METSTALRAAVTALAAALVFAVGLADGFAPDQAIDPVLHERIRTEARQGWDAWEKQARHVEAQFSESRWFKQPDGSFQKEVGSEFRFHIFSAGGKLRADFSKEQMNGQWAEHVSVFRAGDYSFRAERASPGGALVPTEVKTKRRPEDLTIPVGLKWPYTIEHRDLRELLDNPGFTITGLSAEGSLVRMQFKHDKHASDPLPQRFVSGHVLLDPERHWGIIEYEVARLPNIGGGFSRMECEYGPEQAGFVPIIRCTLNSVRKDGEIGAKEVWEFSVCRPNNQPDSFYTFKAVGLPDLARSSAGWSPWFWAIVAGILCLMAAWSIRKRWLT